jgi:hypothetical protein
VPPGTIYAGNPAKYLKDVSPDLGAIIDRTANNYITYSGWFKEEE